MDDLKKRLGLWIVLGLILIISVLQLIPFLGLDPNFEQLISQVLAYLYYAYLVLIYLSLSILIFIETENLQEFHIDRFTLITFILGSIIRPRLGLYGENVFLLLIGSAGIFVALTLIRKKPKIPITNLNWVKVGIGISSAVVIVLTLLVLTFPYASAHFINSKISTALGLILREFSSSPMIEEILMRGFLWGYLRREGMSENKVIWIQGCVFWLLHISKVFTPFTFFVAIPLLAILCSKLTFHSKQLFPAFISHLLINVVSAIFGWAAY
jgi:hypothetical protein